MTVIPIIAPLGSGDPSEIGPYRLLGRLGAGGMGQVYLGLGADRALAAVKVVHAQYTADPRFRARFAREVATARAIRGHGIVALLDADPGARVPWLATEYVPGQSLEQAVTAGGALPERSVAVLGARLAEALVALHALEVVHRDVKPSNVLLAADGPKLIDFGIARAVDATALTHTGAVLGAPGFMSPEQALGDEVGTPSDVFSFASVLVFAALGRGPFGHSSTPVAMLRRVVDQQPDLAGLPGWLRTELEPCFAKDPAGRPTAAELAARLAAHQQPDGAWPPPLVAGQQPTVPVAAETPSLPSSRTSTPHLSPGIATDRPPSRLLTRRTVLAGIGTVAVAGVGVGIAATNGLWDEETRPIRWSFDADAAVASLAVSDGVPYVLSRAGTVYALDPTTGRPRWMFALRESPRGLQAAPGACYAADGSRLYALDATTGHLRWTKEGADLATVSGQLPVSITYEDRGYVLAGLDPGSGATRWAHPLRDGEHVDDNRVVTDGRVHVGLETRMVTLDDGTGALQWEHPWSSGYVSDQKLTATTTSLFSLIGGGSHAVGLDPASGVESWRQPVPRRRSGYHDIVASGETVYLSGLSELAALDAKTGEPRWTTEQPVRAPTGKGAPPLIDSVPVVGDDTCYVVEQSSDETSGAVVYLYQVSARSIVDGDTRWTSPLARLTDADSAFSMALSHDTLFIGASVGTGDAKTGTIYAVSTD